MTREQVASMLLSRGAKPALSSLDMNRFNSKALRDLFSKLDSLDDCLPFYFGIGSSAEEFLADEGRRDFGLYSDDQGASPDLAVFLVGDSFQVFVDPFDDAAHLFVASVDVEQDWSKTLVLRHAGLTLWEYLESLALFLSDRPGLRLDTDDARLESAEAEQLTSWLKSPSDIWSGALDADDLAALVRGEGDLLAQLPWMRDVSDGYFFRACVESYSVFPFAVRCVELAVRTKPLSARAVRLASTIAWYEIPTGWPDSSRKEAVTGQKRLVEALRIAAEKLPEGSLRDVIALRSGGTIN